MTIVSKTVINPWPSVMHFPSTENTLNSFRKQMQCSWCKETGWKGPTMARVPEPMPERENHGHYKDVFDTSNKGDTGEPRPVGGFTPRANLKKTVRDE